MQKYMLLASALMLATPALAQSATEKTGVNSALGVAPSTDDFVHAVAISDMFEVQSSETAIASATDPKTKDFARHMVEAHNKTSAELKSVINERRLKVSIPTKMDETHAKKLANLKEYKEGDFTEQYRDDQEEAHEDAVSLFQRYADGGDNPDLKAWAAKTLPELQRHLEMAKALDQ